MKSRNLRLFYIHQAFFTFTDSIYSITFPLFLYKTFHSISMVFAWTFSWNLIYGLLFIPLFNLAMKWEKPKYFMALGVVFYVVASMLMGSITSEKPWLIFTTLLAFSLYLSFYWMVRHWFFSVNADHLKIGKQISWLAIINMVASFIGPVAGGALSYWVSFNAAFWLGGIGIFCSLIPVLLFNAPPHTEHYSFKTIYSILQKPALKAIRSTYLWEGFSGCLINWPWVLVFGIFLGNIKDLGILIGFSTFIAAILTRLTGHFFDLKKRIPLLNLTTPLNVVGRLLYASVYFFPITAYVWVVDIFNRFVGSMHGTVIDSYLFGYSNKIHPIYFHLNREVHLTIARGICTAILVIAFYFLPPEYLWVSITLGALMILGWLNLKRSDHLLR
ncbi:MAG: MFS transporter [Candidatus Peregrinibacteria bacterium]